MTSYSDGSKVEYYEPGSLSSGYRATIYIHKLNGVDIYMDSKESIIDGILTKEKYVYNPSNHQVKEKIVTLEGNKLIKNIYTYPNDYNCGIYLQMVNKNMISNVIEMSIFKGDNYIGGEVTEFNWDKSKRMILPQYKYFSEVGPGQTNLTTFNCLGPNKTIFPTQNIKYDQYDQYGNIVEIRFNDATNVVYLWSYGGQYPIAEIKGASYSEVEIAAKSAFSVTSINDLSQKASVTVAQLNNFRNHASLKNAMVATYTYKPLVGMTSMTDPSGKTTYYEYDEFNRLKQTKDPDKNVIESYEYNYRNK